MRRFFITGTDTDCGKTYVTCQLLEFLISHDNDALAIKPVASGCFERDGQWQNEDLIHLQKYNVHSRYSINGWQFPSPVSPHLAAKETGYKLSIKEIAAFCQKEEFDNLDYLLIEGAGGLLVPLNEQETWLDFLQLTQIPVILVVGMRLGCINHALLTDVVLQINHIPCAGWIANCLDPNMLALADNIATLKQKLHMPLLATIPHQGALDFNLSGIGCHLNKEYLASLSEK
ncbi:MULTISPECIES: dethiobiotin synthase [unclassified Legionella]|uniref:dethiobiotin synthase n=1 Tax=unclassified Legionella TaxID=2622702 RepID=UPI0010547D85|nr:MULTISPECIES: dethiobiotin synthase [unclassified Legionella]MDI9818801.1 dethiobiotin synthase [Legionella sp. PL877]